jgi:D-sedoheptulose 7-phosphate isomerase
VVIAISASGNSPNVLRAIELAGRARARTIAFTGFNGGKLGPMVDLHIHVPSNIIEHVEDIHLMIEHLVCKALREMAREQPYQDPYRLPVFGREIPGPAAASAPENAGLARLAIDLLATLSRELSQGVDLPSSLPRILSLLLERMGASSGSFVIFDQGGQVDQATLAYAGQIDSHTSASALGNLAEVLERGLARWVVDNRQAALVSSTRDDPRWLRRDWERMDDSSRSAVSVPVMDRDRVFGVLTLVHPQAGQFTGEHMVLLTSIAMFLSLNRAGTQANRSSVQ